jgi:anti-sigma factor RsiW
MLREMRENLREMRTCHEVGQWLQHYLDGELEPPRTEQVEDHLKTCVRCGLEIDTYTRIKSALHDAAGHSPALIDDEVALQRLRRFAEELTADPESK